MSSYYMIIRRGFQAEKLEVRGDYRLCFSRAPTPMAF